MPLLQFPSIRQADVAALKEAGDLPGLIRLLHDRDPKIQWQAADALGSLGTPAIPLLVRELDSRHVAARIGAVEALGAIRDWRVVPHLVDVMEHDHNIEVRWVAALALGNIGDPRAIPPSFPPSGTANGTSVPVQQHRSTGSDGHPQTRPKPRTGPLPCRTGTR